MYVCIHTDNNFSLQLFRLQTLFLESSRRLTSQFTSSLISLHCKNTKLTPINSQSPSPASAKKPILTASSLIYSSAPPPGTPSLNHPGRSHLASSTLSVQWIVFRLESRWEPNTSSFVLQMSSSSGWLQALSFQLMTLSWIRSTCWSWLALLMLLSSDVLYLSRFETSLGLSCQRQLDNTESPGLYQ